MVGLKLLSRVGTRGNVSQLNRNSREKDVPLQDNLNIHGAYLEVFADTIGSVGVIAEGILIETTRYYQADPLISIGIVTLIIPRTWLLLKKAIHILIVTIVTSFMKK